MLPGEKLLNWTRSVTHFCPFEDSVFGSLYITNFKLVFEKTQQEAKGEFVCDVSFLFYFSTSLSRRKNEILIERKTKSSLMAVEGEHLVSLLQHPWARSASQRHSKGREDRNRDAKGTLKRD